MVLLAKPKVTPRQRWLRRLAVVSLILLGLFAWKGYPAAKSRYQHWKQDRALERARVFLEAKDPAAAKLELDIALAAVPGSLDAIRVAAELLDQVGSSQALSLRRRLVEASPASIPERLALAATALRLRDFNAAREALRGLPDSAADQPEVLRAHLAYALALDQRPIADALFDRLDTLGLHTEDTRLAHDTLLRLHPDPAKSAAARTRLESLAAQPGQGLAIHRILYADAISRRDFTAARRHAAAVVADPAATFSDRLNEANLSLLVDKQPFDSLFAALAPGATADARAAAEFYRWLLVQNQLDVADRWLATLPPEFGASPDLLAVGTDRAIVQKDWPQLASLLRAGAWGKLPEGMLENAFAARAVADTEREITARKPVWAAAIASAAGDRTALRALLRLATAWTWDDEAEHLLLAILRADPTQAWAHTALMDGYRRRGDGARMLEVVTILKNSAPASNIYRHDWALLTLLATPSAKWDAPKETARELALAEPANTTYALTHALALAQVGKIGDARRIVEKIPAADRDYPPRAPYLAFIHGLARQAPEFDKYAATASRLRLLKEERRLLAVGEFSLGRTAQQATPTPAP